MWLNVLLHGLQIYVCTSAYCSYNTPSRCLNTSTHTLQMKTKYIHLQSFIREDQIWGMLTHNPLHWAYQVINVLIHLITVITFKQQQAETFNTITVCVKHRSGNNTKQHFPHHLGSHGNTQAFVPKWKCDNGLSMVCLWSVNDLSVVCQWSVYILSMVYQWSINGLSMVLLWSVYGLSIVDVNGPSISLHVELEIAK